MLQQALHLHRPGAITVADILSACFYSFLLFLLQIMLFDIIFTVSCSCSVVICLKILKGEVKLSRFIFVYVSCDYSEMH